MVSVIIPTLDPGEELVATLAALVPAMVDEVVREVIIVDGGSSDRTEALADASGATFVRAPCGRGSQLATGARNARHPWLLFLHADTVLENGWHREVRAHIERARRDSTCTDGPQVDRVRNDAAMRAAVFRFALDDHGWRPRLIEHGVALRCRLAAMPYGDQGLLISRALYDEIGGFREMPLFEDVDIVRRLGRRRLALLGARAVTGARRYRDAGYTRRVLRNWWCLALYAAGRPIERIERIYHG
jgi:glycosyltransferase involved in cell wall biosynthesis